MMLWIQQNLSTIIVAAVLAAITIAVIVKLVRDRQKGKAGCGCGCSACPMSDSCHSQQTS